jgi:voltage-gated potassium channel
MNLFRGVFRRLHDLHYKATRNEAVVIFAAGLTVILIGTFVYAWLEGWTLLDSLYATVITITTVGYGDLSPHSPLGRLFAVFFTLGAVGIAGYAISVLAASVIERQSTKVARALGKRNMNRIENLNRHIIICGSDFVGGRIALEYQRTKTPFILIEANEATLKQALLLLIPAYQQATRQSFASAQDVDLSAYEKLTLAEAAEAAGVAYIHGAATDDTVLWRAGIARAAGLLATLPDDRDNLLVVVGARALARQAGNEGLRIMSRVEDMRNIRKLYFSGVDEVRTPNSVGGAEMALHMTNPELAKWWYRRFNDEAGTGHFAQITVAQERPAWLNQPVDAIQAAESVLILAIKRGDKYLSPPPQRTIVQDGDIAITFR